MLVLNILLRSQCVLQHGDDTYVCNPQKGFKSIYKKKSDVLSISYIENNFDKLVEKGIIAQEGKEYILDTTAFKYDKVLGNGAFTKKLTLVCNDISENAKAKIEAAGGKVQILKAKEAPAQEGAEGSHGLHTFPGP